MINIDDIQLQRNYISIHYKRTHVINDGRYFMILNY